jgi:hypothetical protein
MRMLPSFLAAQRKRHSIRLQCSMRQMRADSNMAKASAPNKHELNTASLVGSISWANESFARLGLWQERPACVFDSTDGSFDRWTIHAGMHPVGPSRDTSSPSSMHLRPSFRHHPAVSSFGRHSPPGGSVGFAACNSDPLGSTRDISAGEISAMADSCTHTHSLALSTPEIALDVHVSVLLPLLLPLGSPFCLFSPRSFFASSCCHSHVLPVGLSGRCRRCGHAFTNLRILP